MRYEVGKKYISEVGTIMKILEETKFYTYETNYGTKFKSTKEGLENLGYKPYIEPLMFEGKKLEVGMEFYGSKWGERQDSYWKIKSIHDDYFMVDSWERNKFQFSGRNKWYPEEIYKLREPKTEYTVEELEKLTGIKNLKVVK